MEQAENAGLLEGDYLKVCNALKQSFEAIHVKSPIINESDVNFILSFKDIFDNSVSLTIHKFIQMRGGEPDKVVYSLMTLDKDGSIDIEERNKVCLYHTMGRKIKNICGTYIFDEFRIINDVGEVVYNVEKVCRSRHAYYKLRNELGPVDDDEDFDYYITPTQVHYEFILCAYRIALDS
jgi:hypothetical protein